MCNKIVKFVLWSYASTDADIDVGENRDIQISKTYDEFCEWLDTDEMKKTIKDLEQIYGEHEFFGKGDKWNESYGFCLCDISENNLNSLMLKWEALLSQGGLL